PGDGLALRGEARATRVDRVSRRRDGSRALVDGCSRVYLRAAVLVPELSLRGSVDSGELHGLVGFLELRDRGFDERGELREHSTEVPDRARDLLQALGSPLERPSPGRDRLVGGLDDAREE